MKYLSILFGIFFCICGSAFAEGVPLLQASGLLNANQEAVVLSNAEREQLKRIRSLSNVHQAILVSLDSSALLSNVSTIVMPNKQTIRLIRSQEERRNPTDFTWHGKTENGGEVTIVSNKNKLYGIILDSGRNFEIRSLGDKFYVLIEIDQRALPPEHPASHPSGTLGERKKPISEIESLISITAASSKSTISNINVLIAYTPLAASTLGEVGSSFQLAIDRINQSFLNSSVNLRVTLAGQMSLPVEYVDSTSALAAVMRALPVLMTRDKTNADIVVLVGHFNDACGVAGQILAAASTAFVAVADSCLNSNLSMAHEIGHLLGARHDIENDSALTPYAYGHGYAGIFNDPWELGKVQVCWHTIMSYARPVATCANDPRINFWSNPNIFYAAVSGNPHPTGVAKSSNVAAVLNLTGSSVASFHNTKLAAGPLAAISAVLSNLFVQDGQ